MVSDAALAQTSGLLKKKLLSAEIKRQDLFRFIAFFKAKPKPKIRFVQLLKINREVYLTAIDIGLD